MFQGIRTRVRTAARRKPATRASAASGNIRVGVSFSPTTVANLIELHGLVPDMSKTDLIGQAIAAYLWLQKQQLVEGASIGVLNLDGTVQKAVIP